MHKSQAGFDPPPADATSYEADTLLTKPPQMVMMFQDEKNSYLQQSGNLVLSRIKSNE